MEVRRAHALIWRRLPRAVTGTSYVSFVSFLVRFLRALLSLDEAPIGLTYPANDTDGTSAQGAALPEVAGEATIVV